EPLVSGSGKRRCRRFALVSMPGQRTCKGCLGDAGDRDAKIQRALHGPAASALLLGLVVDDVDEGLAGVGVDVPGYVRTDLDQVGLEVAGVPVREDAGDFVRRRPKSASEQV